MTVKINKIKISLQIMMIKSKNYTKKMKIIISSLTINFQEKINIRIMKNRIIQN
jgi:hypothetical protein